MQLIYPNSLGLDYHGISLITMVARINRRLQPGRELIHPSPHSLDLSVAFLFGFTSSSDSDSSLILFAVVLALEGDFFTGAPTFDDGLPPALEGGLEAAIEGGLGVFSCGFSSSSEANGSSSTFFFLSCSLGLALGFVVGSATVPSPLTSSPLVSTSSFLAFAASRSEKNWSLSCCWRGFRRVHMGGDTVVP